MTTTRTTLGVVAMTAAVVLPLAACGGGSTTDAGGGGGGGQEGGRGGTLYYLTRASAEHLDPQRTYIGRDTSNLGRLAYRSLVQFPVTEDAANAATPVPDLATDTGTSADGGKRWSFTLKDGVRWQDGKDVTCADLKYGLSRTFATDVITGGPNYVLGYLDVPKAAGGAAAYTGPYTKQGQADFDKAVTCEGKTITYRFTKPWPDFPLAVASLRAFDPYRADQDQGAKSNFAVFSSGPYKLEGNWQKGTGGTYVRNDQYDPATDGVRRALPDKIVVVEGLTDEIVAGRIIADAGNDRNAVSDRRVPPALYADLDARAGGRVVDPVSPYVDYLVPNFNRMTDPKVRRALAMSTNKAGYIAALGGGKSGLPAKSIVNPAIPGYRDNPNFTAPPEGDPAAARKLLAEAGAAMPYPLTFTYNALSPAIDKAAAALKAGWDEAGFSVTLDPLTDTYYDIVQNPSNNKSDVMWGGWGADWPSASTVIPALFDARINLSEKSNGQDYGNYRSDAVNALIDEAAAAPDTASQAAKLFEADDQLGKDTAYIPLAVQRFTLVRGGNVTNYINNPAVHMYPDLGSIGVKQ